MNKPTTLYFFYSDWCGMCKILRPQIENLQQQFNHSIDFQYINTEDNVNLAIEYEIRSLPTLVLVQKQKVVWKNIGKFTPEALVTVLDYFSK